MPGAEGFVSDGCTGFFDVWRGIDILACCTAHDLAWYNHPGDWGVWLSSNFDLAGCFFDKGVWEIAVLGFIAVSTVGALLFASKKRST